jgi:selenocysteine lyase/cysteine desulfurase
VNAHTSKFTDKTKVVHLTHVINWVGQVIPTRKIADKSHEMGIEVTIDGAHSFAQMEYNIPDLGADYYATSLHKWLCAPFGTGLMYVKKEKIANLWPVLSAPEPLSDDIRKFENLGTRNMMAEMSTLNSIEFHNNIGIKRKRERLLYLRNYWMNKVKNHPKLSFYNSFRPEFICALANVSAEGFVANELASTLLNDYNVHTVGIVYESVNGLRVTPNVYTSTDDLDIFTDSLLKAIES